MATFKELGLSDDILKLIEELGFHTPTQIQEEAIPKLITGQRDFIGLAQTGTGKTAAFGLPLLERIDPAKKHTQALILAPTRELGQQIAEQLESYSKYLDKINVLAVYGGAAITNQIKALKKTRHIIIATPGRLIDLIKRSAVHLDKLEVLVLDEADEMLNMGFKEELDKILSYTPEDKMTWLFSATMPHEIKRIVQKYMSDPLEIKANKNIQVNADIDHQYTIVKREDKMEALTRFLDSNADMHGLVFCRTRAETQSLAEILQKKNYKSDSLHGDLSQQQRDRVMKAFKNHNLQVLIATDVAARGIDVNDLSHVFHFSLPDDNSYYTHRSGRTARAGKKGISLAFINGREGVKIQRLEQQLGISFSKVEIPQSGDVADKRIEQWCNKILEQEAKGKIDEKLFEKVSLLFGGLTKEELIAKILVGELGKLTMGSSRDLNDMQTASRADRKGPRERRDRDESRSRDDRGRDRDRGDRRSTDRPRSREKVESRSSDRGRGRETPARDSSRRSVEQPAARVERKSQITIKGKDAKGKEIRSKSGELSLRGDKDRKPRFFINIGSRDKITKQDLKDFVCSVAKVKRSDIGEIELQKSCSFFEVESTIEKKISQKFNGMQLEDGRELRVNRDN